MQSRLQPLCIIKKGKKHIYIEVNIIIWKIICHLSGYLSLANVYYGLFFTGLNNNDLYYSPLNAMFNSFVGFFL